MEWHIWSPLWWGHPPFPPPFVPLVPFIPQCAIGRYCRLVYVEGLEFVRDSPCMCCTMCHCALMWWLFCSCLWCSGAVHDAVCPHEWHWGALLTLFSTKRRSQALGAVLSYPALPCPANFFKICRISFHLWSQHRTRFALGPQGTLYGDNRLCAGLGSVLLAVLQDQQRIWTMVGRWSLSLASMWSQSIVFGCQLYNHTALVSAMHAANTAEPSRKHWDQCSPVCLLTL